MWNCLEVRTVVGYFTASYVRPYSVDDRAIGK